MPSPPKRPGASDGTIGKGSTEGGSDATALPEGSPPSTPTPPTRTATPPPPKDAVVGSGEFRSSADRRTGLVSGIKSFGVKRITYSNVNGKGIFEGDIDLGPVEKLVKTKAAADSMSLDAVLSASGSRHAEANIQYSVAITGQRYRWPGGLIPYETPPEIQAVVEQAIAHWQARTSIRFIERTPFNATTYPNYVSFEVGNGCFSAVGMQGGSQPISIGLGCGIGQAIHEIGHTVGLWHEQSREDRDQFIRIAWENIIPDMEHNFDQHITDGDDIGPYDYDSIMHYPATAFSSNGLDTIVALGGQAIGQRDGLSDRDVAAVLDLYPGTVGSASHMYTSLILELAGAISNQGYRSDGVGFYAWDASYAGTVPLYRLTDSSGKQLYTSSTEAAYDAISKKGFTYDSVACYLYGTPGYSLSPLFRLENDAQKDSLFTTSLQEAQQAASHGYAGQGVAGYVFESYVPGTLPVYRLSKVA